MAASQSLILLFISSLYFIYLSLLTDLGMLFLKRINFDLYLGNRNLVNIRFLAPFSNSNILIIPSRNARKLEIHSNNVITITYYTLVK